MQRRHPPTVSVDAQSDQITPAQCEAAIDGPVLRHVADPFATGPHRLTLDERRASAERKLPEENLQQGGLSGAVRTEHRDELTG